MSDRDNQTTSEVAGLRAAQEEAPPVPTWKTFRKPEPTQPAAEFTAQCNGVRRAIKALAADTKTLRIWAGGSVPMAAGADRGDAIANLMLAYRHLEDASMRLGKAIQAADGGVSVYDKDTTVGA